MVQNKGKIKEEENALYVVKVGKGISRIKNRAEIGLGEYELLETTVEDLLPN